MTTGSSQSIKDATTKYYQRFFKNFIFAIIIVVFTFDIATLQRNVANAEYFSSIDMLQKLGDVELGLAKAFRRYLEMQENEFESFEKFIKHVKNQHRIAEEDPEDYLGNPINAFTLIKRMVTDWNHLHDYIKESEARTLFREMLDEFQRNHPLPDENELKGAVKGLARLQKVYDLKADDLANGEINGIYYGTKLSWSDCFEIAANLYDQKDYSLALNWFKMALEKLDRIATPQKTEIEKRFETETLEYLALTNYELGNSEEAVDFIDELLELSPNHHTKDMRTYILTSPRKKKPSVAKPSPFNWYGKYMKLCQGKQTPEPKLHKLKCIIDRRDKPSFLLAPLKIEQLSLDPEVNVYHGLLNDAQIQRIISQAEDKMARSQVKNGTSGVASDVRISQQAWLKFESPTMRTIYNLVSDITNFDLKNAEFMQMANYGIGGQYEPHNDFFGPGGFDNKIWIGDRIVTNMFYLSDVEQGGYTVFPRLNLYSRPIKGSLIVWHNLHRSLDPDYRTLHAGCPVIKGSKRIGNVWVHSGYQEFRRPCDLTNDAYKSVHLQTKAQAEKAMKANQEQLKAKQAYEGQAKASNEEQAKANESQAKVNQAPVKATDKQEDKASMANKPQANDKK